MERLVSRNTPTRRRKNAIVVVEEDSRRVTKRSKHAVASKSRNADTFARAVTVETKLFRRISFAARKEEGKNGGGNRRNEKNGDISRRANFLARLPADNNSSGSGLGMEFHFNSTGRLHQGWNAISVASVRRGCVSDSGVAAEISSLRVDNHTPSSIHEFLLNALCPLPSNP